MNRIAMVMGAVAATTPTLWASIVYTSQNRFIRARGEASLGSIVDEHTITAPDFGPFDQSIEAEAVDPFTMISGWGRAQQESILDPLHIGVNGQWSGGRTGQGASGGGTSSFSVNFTLDEAADYVFTATAVPGMFYIFGGPDGFALTTLGTFSGTLAPGDYFMSGAVTGSAGFPPSGGGFTMDLVIVPGPGAALVLATVFLARRRR
ncbi:MAG: hypothetical protein IT436_19170 [Phycisphaerales bacterium]|nr:hypothetical protein [Phycisphaerales bacterium]